MVRASGSQRGLSGGSKFRVFFSFPDPFFDNVVFIFNSMQQHTVCVRVKASPAFGGRRLHTNTAYGHLLGFQRAFQLAIAAAGPLKRGCSGV